MNKQTLRMPVVMLALAAAGVACSPKPIAAPGIVDVAALDKDGKELRKLGGLPSLSRDEALDFHVELTERGFVYVFRAAQERTTLEWGPGVDPKPLEPGTWAPEWADDRVKGLRFGEGEARLYVLATREVLGEVSAWPEKDLEAPHGRCPLCSVATLRFTVTRPAAGADAGP